MMTIIPPILQVEQATACRPGEQGGMQVVVQDVSLSVKPGEVVAVVGPSGGGKSSLLRLCNRLLEPTSGRILYSGQDIRSLSPPALRKQIALVAQKPFLFQGTVRDNLSMPARLNALAPPNLESPENRGLLDLCQVASGWLERDARRLSLGQQQRICLARALMGSCQVLLLDEPTSALDRPTAATLTQTFRDLATENNLALLLVTHDLRVAEDCADRVLVMLDGLIVEEGTAEQVMNSSQNQAVKDFIGRSTTVSGGER